MKKNLTGKLACVLQLILSVTLMGEIHLLGILPEKYEKLLALVLAGCLVLCFLMQFMKKGMARVFMVISFIISAGLIVGIYEVSVADQALEKIANVDKEIDNMVVVVKKDNPAKELKDAADYRFGIQTTADKDNTDKMVKKVSSIVGRKILLSDTGNVSDLAQALLDGKVEAAIYNASFNDMLEDNMEGYKEKVRVLYKFGLEKKVDNVKEKEAQPLKKGQDSFNVYISGIDVSGPIQTKSRSDVNIIASINTETKEILLTSTPRDYYVPIPGVSGEARDKLTHAGIYGVDASMRTLEQVYDVDLPYYTRVNFTSLIKLVDILGGVDVESDYAFTSNAGGYSFNKGINHLDGKRALAFARERYSFTDGDSQRGRNQEKVLTAIIQKMLSPDVITRVNSIIGQMSDSMQTNIPQETISDLVKMQIADGAKWQIGSQSVTGKGDSTTCFSMGSTNVYVMWPDEESVGEAQDAMHKLLENQK